MNVDQPSVRAESRGVRRAASAERSIVLRRVRSRDVRCHPTLCVRQTGARAGPAGGTVCAREPLTHVLDRSMEVLALHQEQALHQIALLPWCT